jgi:cystathionine beta-synthase
MVVRQSTSKEKLDCLRAVGVELVLVDGTLPPTHPESYNRKASLLAKETENAFFPDQHNNRDNNEAHYLTTGPEIWEQMDGDIDYFVAGIGTGGTICGAGQYLKEKDPSIKVIAVDPVGSVFYDFFKTGKVGGTSGYVLEGLGDEEIIGCPDFDIIDDIIQIKDGESFLATRELAENEAILAGGSSGAVLLGIRRLAASIGRAGESVGGAAGLAGNGPGALMNCGNRKRPRIVTIFPDSGSRYLSTIYNDEWMQSKGFL